MFLSTSITIPPNTLGASPTKVVLGIAYGVITKVIVRPRPGHASLAHLKVYYHGHQLFPYNRDDDLHGDAFPIEWEDYIELFTPPWILVLEGWNDDDTYPHTFDFGVAVIEKRFTLAFALAKAISQLAGIFSPKRIFGGSK